MHTEVSDWADFVDENSNLSMKSVDFGELPLQKLERSNSCSRDRDLDYSREGLNLLVSNALRLSERSNSNCSTSRKRVGENNTCPRDFSSFVSKRRKIVVTKEPPTPKIMSPHHEHVFLTQCERITTKSSLSFAEILKATNVRKKEDHIKQFQVNTRPIITNTKGTRSKVECSWAQKLYSKNGVSKNDTKVESFEDITKLGVIDLPKRFEDEIFEPPVRRKIKPKSCAITFKPKSIVNKKNGLSHNKLGKENKHSKDRPNITSKKGRRSLKRNTFPNATIPDHSDRHVTTPSLSTFKYPRTEQMSIASFPKKPRFEQKATEKVKHESSHDKCQVLWQMPKKPGMIITKTKSSPDLLMWGTPNTPLIPNRLTGHGITNPPGNLVKKTATSPNFMTTRAAHKSLDCRTTKASPSTADSTHGSYVNSSLEIRNCASAIQQNAEEKSISPDPTPTKSARSPPAFVAKSESSETVTLNGGVTQNTNALGQLINITDSQIKKRMRQIELGKQTAGYLNYLKKVPKGMRSLKQPRTPDARERISKRRFTGKLRAWRRKLHQWDEDKSESSAGTVPSLTKQVSSPVFPSADINSTQ